LWDMTNLLAQPIVLGGQGPSISALAFAPDGRLISGSEDGATRVWDLKNPSAQPLVLRGHSSLVAILGFAPDGRLVIGSDDGTLRLWDIDLDHSINLARLVAGRNFRPQEWKQFFGSAPYRRTFGSLPDGADLKEERMTQSASGSSSSPNTSTPESSAKP
jgi:WD40 repeat protein